MWIRWIRIRIQIGIRNTAACTIYSLSFIYIEQVTRLKHLERISFYHLTTFFASSVPVNLIPLTHFIKRVSWIRICFSMDPNPSI
jgi:hypothetical protein